MRSGGRVTRIRDTAATRLEPRRTPSARTTGSINRSGSRPAAARRAATAGATKRTVATRPKAFTGRATVLIVVLVTLALAYTYPVRVYLAQQSEIAQMQADQSAQQATIQGLQEEADKWKDPEYVRIQARDRFAYVRPGETPLLVLNDPAGAARDAGGATATTEPGRWYDTLWGSVAAANAESRK
ncbi:enolase 1 [Actinoplanes sp. N902-109]|nr:enolase 1 [Actinoplanes sp. N902-109]